MFIKSHFYIFVYNIVKRGYPIALLYAEQVEYLDVEEMQATHEEEIKILNEVEKLATGYIINKSNLSQLEAELDEYIAHVKEHFANEERLMRKYDFPPLMKCIKRHTICF